MSSKQSGSSVGSDVSPDAGAGEEVVVCDLSIAQPAAGIAQSFNQPEPDKWLLLPYEGDPYSGTMLYIPPRTAAPDVSIPLPAIGSCEIHVGQFGSGTVPVWFNLYGGTQNAKTWHRNYLKLDDEDWFDVITPEHYPEHPRLNYISERYWKHANLTGQSLVLRGSRKEGFLDTHSAIAYIRLVPTRLADAPVFPRETKRLMSYYDCNFWGHFVASREEIKEQIEPMREADYEGFFWTTCREDSCYYPTKVGNVLPWHGVPGVYPHYQSLDLQRMLDKGEDPLSIVCEEAHSAGLKVYASYRRMTQRMSPYLYPLCKDAFSIRHPELRTQNAAGETQGHLSLCYPEVRNLTTSLLREQAEHYDIDGVHLFFSRSVPFVGFEQPFLDAFKEQHDTDEDPRKAGNDDVRLWDTRATFVMQLLREIRAMLDEVGEAKGKRFEIAMHVMHSPEACHHYGLHVPTMAKENLVDVLVPALSAFLPLDAEKWANVIDPITNPAGHVITSIMANVAPAHVAQFKAIAEGSNMRIYPLTNANRFGKGGETLAQMAEQYYKAGADGLETSITLDLTAQREVTRRLGHKDEVASLDDVQQRATRLIKFEKMAGLSMSLIDGIPNAG